MVGLIFRKKGGQNLACTKIDRILKTITQTLTITKYFEGAHFRSIFFSLRVSKDRLLFFFEFTLKVTHQKVLANSPLRSDTVDSSNELTDQSLLTTDFFY